MRSVLLLGDSHLAKMDKPLVTALEDLIGDTVVHNAAMGGADSADVARRAPLLARIPWDAVVVSVGTNDLAPWKQLPIPEFTANLRRTLDLFGSSRVVVVGPPPVDDRAQTGRYRRSTALVRAYAAAAEQVADETAASFLDLAAVLDAAAEQGLPAHLGDGVHLSPAGYALLVPALARAVVSHRGEHPDRR